MRIMGRAIRDLFLSVAGYLAGVLSGASGGLAIGIGGQMDLWWLSSIGVVLLVLGFLLIGAAAFWR